MMMAIVNMTDRLLQPTETLFISSSFSTYFENAHDKTDKEKPAEDDHKTDRTPMKPMEHVLLRQR